MLLRENELFEFSASAEYRREDLGNFLGKVQLTFFVSCYNEEVFISSTLATIREAVAKSGVQAEVVIIDDGSKDKSSQFIRDFMRQNPDMRIIFRQNKVNRGLAQNYIDGAFIGSGDYYRLICGDNSHPTESLVSTMALMGKADMILPYYTESRGKPWIRRKLSAAFTRLVNWITGYKIKYYNGLGIHRRFNVMRWHPNTHGFGFQADIICMLLDQGNTYVEVPILDIHSNDNSQALTIWNVFSVGHTIIDLFIRKVTRSLHARYKIKPQQNDEGRGA